MKKIMKHMDLIRFFLSQTLTKWITIRNLFRKLYYKLYNIGLFKSLTSTKHLNKTTIITHEQ